MTQADKEWRQTARGKQKRSANAKRYTKKLKLEALRAYGGLHPCCSCCGEDRMPFLTLDHLDDSGWEQRRDANVKSGWPFYQHLRNLGWPKEPPLAVVCYNCNCGRWVNGGTCPHKEEKALEGMPELANAKWYTWILKEAREQKLEYQNAIGVPIEHRRMSLKELAKYVSKMKRGSDKQRSDGIL